MKIKLLAVTVISIFSLNASAELKLALGMLESLKKCKQGDADECALHEKIKKYNRLAADCNEEIDGWFGDKPHSSVPQCVQAEAILNEGDIKLEED